MLCLNPRCRKPLSEYQWGEGYCSGECMDAHLAKGETVTQCLHDPTGHYRVAETTDEIDAMLEAAEIDPRLPRIIYFRKQRKPFRFIAHGLCVDEKTVRNILAKSARKLLRRCGLRRK